MVLDASGMIWEWRLQIDLLCSPCEYFGYFYKSKSLQKYRSLSIPVGFCRSCALRITHVRLFISLQNYEAKTLFKPFYFQGKCQSILAGFTSYHKLRNISFISFFNYLSLIIGLGYCGQYPSALFFMYLQCFNGPLCL